MRKRIVELPSRQASVEGDWLDLDPLARVEITSESGAHPIESALTPGAGPGWRASGPGEQLIRLLFDRPQTIRRIRVLFREEEHPRTQEFTLRWRREGEEVAREIVRQQYNFNPPGTTEEVEEYRVELDGVTALELDLVPDIAGGDAPATLAELRLA